MSICGLSGGEFGSYLFGMYCWARLLFPSAEVVGETCESIKVEVCGNCNRRERSLSCVSMSKLLCLRPSDALPVINVETVWELHSNFFLVSKKWPHRFYLDKAKKRVFMIECFVYMLCLILVIGS